MNIVLYARVSSEAQSGDDRVSISQQLEDMRAQANRQSWVVVDELIDAENYIATSHPNKGLVVNPSGERADRPALLALLEKVKTSEVDAVVCWRDDRLVRHPRVAVALEDALDSGDTKRNGRGKIQIYDATGASIDRFTLSIKATIWREENKRRVERGKMGKIGTLREGRWPGTYQRYGYKCIKEPGRRGTLIQLGDPIEIGAIRNIFEWYTHGVPLIEIRRRLIAHGTPQAGSSTRIHDWSPEIIYKILRCEDYTGQATYKFKENEAMVIAIPAIINKDQWELAQRITMGNKHTGKRNAKDVFMLQGLAFCGECGSRIGALERRYNYRTMKDGSRKRYDRKTGWFYYYCYSGSRVTARDNHIHPVNWSGPLVDEAIWRKIVEDGIKNPDNIRNQILEKQSALLDQGGQVSGTISRLRDRITAIDEERAAYQRMFARRQITEKEFCNRMEETEDIRKSVEIELDQLTELRDDHNKVNAGLKYAEELMAAIQETLPQIDLSHEEMKALDPANRRWIQEQRRKIVLALVDKAVIYSNGRIALMGVLDGSEVSLIESPST